MGRMQSWGVEQIGILEGFVWIGAMGMVTKGYRK